MNALHRVNAEEMAAHYAVALAPGLRLASATTVLVDLRNWMQMRLASRLGIAGWSSQRSLSLESRTILEGRIFKARISLFLLLYVSTAHMPL
jgi:hypothetical protein